MTQTSTAMRWGANFTALSAGFHLLAFPVSGFSADALILLPFALVYAGLLMVYSEAGDGWHTLSSLSCSLA